MPELSLTNRRVYLTLHEWEDVVNRAFPPSLGHDDLRRKLLALRPWAWRHGSCLGCPITQATGDKNLASQYGALIDQAVMQVLGHVALDHDTPIEVRR